MKKQLPHLLWIFLLFVFFVTPAYAVSITLSNIPSSITADSFTFSASISGAATGTNYLRVDLYKDGTTNYFGETYNGNNWYGDSDYTQYLPISITSGQVWNGQIQARVGNPTITQYDATGTYRLRLRRYTSSGNYTSSEADSTSTIVAIAVPTITPTPLPTNTPAPTNSPTPTARPPTATPTLKPTILSKVVSPTSSSDVGPTEEATQDGVLGDISEITPSPSPTTAVLGASARPNYIAIVFYVLGGTLFAICGILLFRQYYESKSHESTSD